MEWLSQVNPEKVGTVAALIVMLVAVIRLVQTRKWVPGVYYDDMRAERDAARAEAKAYGATLASATQSLAIMTDSLKTLADAHAMSSRMDRGSRA